MASPFLAGFGPGLLDTQNQLQQQALRQVYQQMAQEQLQQARMKQVGQAAAGGALTDPRFGNLFGQGPMPGLPQPQPQAFGTPPTPRPTPLATPGPQAPTMPQVPAPMGPAPPGATAARDSWALPGGGSPAIQTPGGEPRANVGLQQGGSTPLEGMQQQLMQQMFRQLNPQQIAQQLKAARPDLDGGTLMEATKALMGMAQSTVKADQIYALGLLRELGRERGQDVRSADTRRGQDIRDTRSQAHEAALDRRFNERQQRLKAVGGATGAVTTQKGAALRSLLKEIDADLAATTDEDKISQLSEQRMEVMDELRKMATLPQRPKADTTEQLPGGGAAAPLPP